MALTNILLANLDGTDGFRLDGLNPNDALGRAVASAGDINGDGFVDVIAGAHFAPVGEISQAGASYVILGAASGFAANIPLDALDGADGFRIDGVDSFDRSGTDVSDAGDVNGDGVVDFIVSAYIGDGDSVNAGETYVIFGRTEGFGAAISLADLDGADGFRLDGIDFNDISGFLASGAGDVNGDGFADIVTGSGRADPNGNESAGETYVVFGKASGFTAEVSLSGLDGADGIRIDGVDADDRAGYAVADAGDVNGDGFDDILIGAYRATADGDALAGESYVVFGAASGLGASIDLALLDGTDGFRMDGVAADDLSGRHVAGAGDFNGDGFDDVVIGAAFFDPAGRATAGASFVVFGKADGFAASIDLEGLDGADGFRVDGAAANDRSGTAVANAGDVNGDGVDDLFIGSLLGDGEAIDASGESHLVFGRTSGFGATVDLAALDASLGFRLDGPLAQDRSGDNLSGAGDVNGDGFADMIIGAYGADPGGDGFAGSSFIVFGFDSGAVTEAGGVGADALAGSTAIDVLLGGLGDDVLTGGGGQDVLKGGAGDDVLAIGDTTFRQTDGGTGVDTLRLAGAGLKLDLTGPGESGLVSIEAADLAGAGAELTLDAQRLLRLSEISNSLTVTGAGAGARLSLADAGWTLTAVDASTTALANGEARAVVPNVLGLGLVGTTGADVLAGRAGDDVLEGGAGDDLLEGGDGDDTADYANAGAGVVVNLTTASASDGEGGADTFDSIESAAGSAFADTLVGDAGANTLIGHDGLDRLNGRAGDDVMIGGAGNDIYTVDDAGDVVTEFSGEGTDRINTSIDFVNADNVEILVGKFAAVGLTLTGNDTRDQITGANKIQSADTIAGEGGNDTLVGLVGDDVIDGGLGDDRIFGNSGADRITGGAGNDVLTGQQNGDRFVFAPGSGVDTVTDFTPGADVIDLIAYGFANFAALDTVLADINGRAQIKLTGNDDVLRLNGVVEADLAESDFILA